MTKNLDWKSLGFAYRETNCHVIYRWQDGKWDEGQIQSEPYLHLHIAATALHYGQSAFEGLKAYRHKNGGVCVFRPDDNARRMQRTARRALMPEVPESMFWNAIQRVVKENLDYLPPYETGGALYIRPLLFGSGAEIGLNPAKEFLFLVLVTPVGDYYHGGINAIDALVVEDYDRAAPKGVGHVKLAGNYAASLLPGMNARAAGFPIALYLDAKEHKYIDEFGTSNFIAISRDGTYITPQSNSILPSITNLSLMQIAQDIGLEVQQRPVQFEEVTNFSEVGACGTAVVISPIRKIVRGDKEYVIQDRNGFGPKMQILYERLRGIQKGEIEDLHGWLRKI